MAMVSLFLGAPTHLYNWLCLSVGLLVGWSVMIFPTLIFGNEIMLMTIVMDYGINHDKELYLY